MFSGRIKRCAPSSYISYGLTYALSLLIYLPPCTYTSPPIHREHLRGKGNDLLIPIVTSYHRCLRKVMKEERMSGREFKDFPVSQSPLSIYHKAKMCS